MGTTTTQMSNIHGYFLLLICSGSWLLHPSQAFKLRGGYGEEKVPLSFIVPDPLPGLSPLAAPPPVMTGDDGMRPRLPTERWRRGRGEERRSRADERRAAHAPAPLAPSSWSSLGPAHAPVPSSAEAPAPESGGGTDSIKSSPAVPVPRGVTDTATILPMPAPGVKRQDMGSATLVRAGMVPLVAALIAMMASVGALC